MNKIVQSLCMGVVALAMVSTSAFAATDETTLQAEINAAAPGDTVFLDNDITLSQEITVNNTDLTIDGNGYTVTAAFAKTDNSNNSAFGVYGSDITFMNMHVDGTGGTNLHGIKVYVAENIVIDTVSATNFRSGIVVNGSTVTVNDVTTAGNTWHGINVDQGGGVTTPAILTVEGTSTHTDALHIFVDHYLSGVRDVVDSNSQYSYVDGASPADYRLYTLIDPAPVTEITSHMDGDRVSGPSVEVWGSVTDNNPHHYYAVLRDSSNSVVAGPGTVNRTDSFTNEVLFTFDSTTLVEGETYTIWLAARDAAGNRDDSAGSLATAEIVIDNTPDDMDGCKKGGWLSFFVPSFKNQGDCVSYVQSSPNAMGNKLK